MVESPDLIGKLEAAQQAIQQEITQNINVYEEIVQEMERISASINPNEVLEAIHQAEKFQSILQRKIDCLTTWKQEYLNNEEQILKLKQEAEAISRLERTKRLLLQGKDAEVVANLEELAQLFEANDEIKSILQERVKRMVQTLLLQQEEDRMTVNGLLKDLLPILNRLELWNVVGKLLREDFVDFFVKKVRFFLC